MFTADYAARVMSAASADEGRCCSSSGCGGGAMRYVVSFYGVVDLLSVLPFFLGLPLLGGLRNLSPKLLPTLVSCFARSFFFLLASFSLSLREEIRKPRKRPAIENLFLFFT